VPVTGRSQRYCSRYLLPVDPNAHAFDLEFLIFEVYNFTTYPT
jgi:hypothetical protein